ncbi:hypothetical protein R5R35_007995 [Gryllus longicercus]|uniref:Uncharacterized protein n=1 Tax=Gryllus longicercus TaxID=2509291 RepID=A0AAN9V9D9_9ORTH
MKDQCSGHVIRDALEAQRAKICGSVLRLKQEILSRSRAGRREGHSHPIARFVTIKIFGIGSSRLDDSAPPPSFFCQHVTLKRLGVLIEVHVLAPLIRRARAPAIPRTSSGGREDEERVVVTWFVTYLVLRRTTSNRCGGAGRGKAHPRSPTAVRRARAPATRAPPRRAPGRAASCPSGCAARGGRRPGAARARSRRARSTRRSAAACSRRPSARPCRRRAAAAPPRTRRGPPWTRSAAPATDKRNEERKKK